MLFLINTERFIHHHQLLYCALYYFSFLSSWVIQLVPYSMILFIVDRHFKSLNQHSILLLLMFVLLPFAFCDFFMLLLFALLLSINYYLLITIIISFSYLLIYLFIFMISIYLWSSLA